MQLTVAELLTLAGARDALESLQEPLGGSSMQDEGQNAAVLAMRSGGQLDLRLECFMEAVDLDSGTETPENEPLCYVSVDFQAAWTTRSPDYVWTAGDTQNAWQPVTTFLHGLRIRAHLQGTFSHFSPRGTLLNLLALLVFLHIPKNIVRWLAMRRLGPLSQIYRRVLLEEFSFGACASTAALQMLTQAAVYTEIDTSGIKTEDGRDRRRQGIRKKQFKTLLQLIGRDLEKTKAGRKQDMQNFADYAWTCLTVKEWKWGQSRRKNIDTQVQEHVKEVQKMASNESAHDSTADKAKPQMAQLRSLTRGLTKPFLFKGKAAGGTGTLSWHSNRSFRSAPSSTQSTNTGGRSQAATPGAVTASSSETSPDLHRKSMGDEHAVLNLERFIAASSMTDPVTFDILLQLFDVNHRPGILERVFMDGSLHAIVANRAGANPRERAIKSDDTGEAWSPGSPKPVDRRARIGDLQDEADQLSSKIVAGTQEGVSNRRLIIAVAQAQRELLVKVKAMVETMNDDKLKNLHLQSVQVAMVRKRLDDIERHIRYGEALPSPSVIVQNVHSPLSSLSRELSPGSNDASPLPLDVDGVQPAGPSQGSLGGLTRGWSRSRVEEVERRVLDSLGQVAQEAIAEIPQSIPQTARDFLGYIAGPRFIPLDPSAYATTPVQEEEVAPAENVASPPAAATSSPSRNVNFSRDAGAAEDETPSPSPRGMHRVDGRTHSRQAERIGADVSGLSGHSDGGWRDAVRDIEEKLVARMDTIEQTMKGHIDQYLKEMQETPNEGSMTRVRSSATVVGVGPLLDREDVSNSHPLGRALDPKGAASRSGGAAKSQNMAVQQDFRSRACNAVATHAWHTKV
mmetsp:Transcript_35483/g.82921  ORF Transcript_35483/g.82921 Transcript_35483/m.82921 type:complete len:852 (+) Transcript_35483:3-2558(+)